MRIGIFGGTFNPVHLGHLVVAEEIRERFHLERMLFVPSARPPHKPTPDLTDARHRLEMVRLAVEDNSRFDLSPLELERRGPSYSVETLASFQREYGEKTSLYFTLGIDSFLDIHTWHDPKRLIGLCHFIVLSRPGFSLRQAYRLLAETFEIHAPEESREVALPNNHRLYLAEVTPVGISSTLIRERIRRGRSVKYLLPGPVESYIISQDLYGG